MSEKRRQGSSRQMMLLSTVNRRVLLTYGGHPKGKPEGYLQGDWGNYKGSPVNTDAKI
jgi:hypothetical protein